MRSKRLSGKHGFPLDICLVLPFLLAVKTHDIFWADFRGEYSGDGAGTLRAIHNV
jgi:hypothetical protein